MKTTGHLLKSTLLFICIFAFAPNANGQFFKKLAKKAEKAAERTVERRAEREAEKKTDQVLDSILEPGKKKKTPKGKNPQGNETTNPDSEENTKGGGPSNQPKSIQVYSKFDFVPGDEQLFFDDFSNDFVGDFPSKWNTNGGGELVLIDDLPNKWLKILPGFNTQYIPDITDLPEEFTLEFDVIANGLSKNTSSQSFLAVIVADNNNFNRPLNMGMVEYSFCQFIQQSVIIENKINGKREIRNDIQTDIRNTVLEKHHISIAINKQRFRMWINEKKYVDVPRLLPANVDMKGIKFGLRGIDINTEAIFLSNIKVAKGGVDLRRKLISEGRISTNGILFDSGSANIQPQSMGIIRQISQVLLQERSMKINIVGHTDSDGADDTNQKLSKSRAEAVKNALVNVYNIDANRLSTEGKGESEPIGDNGTVEGKAQNRRVEFVKQ